MGDKIPVKEERGAPLFKPKFVPKALVKKEPGAEPPKVVVKAETAKPDNKPRERKDRRDDRGGRGKGGRDGHNQHRGGRDGGKGGRGPWVMPVGQAFFTGNSTKALASQAAAVVLPTKTERVARPNEVIDDLSLSAAEYEALERARLEQEDADDSDASMDEDGQRGHEQKTAHIEGLERWPPSKYDHTAPCALPFGPKTVTMRRALAAQPILADPSDQAALIDEENQTLFLMQLPSDLRIETLTRQVDPLVEDDSKAPLLGSDRKLGKLRLYRSGKVKLVTENGNSYDVSPGVTACFMQCLVSAEVPEDDEAITTSSSSSSAAAKQRETAVKDGSLCFLGNITRKLVITPNYELGSRKKSSSSAASRAAVGVKQEGEGADLLPDDDVMFFDS